MPRRRVRRYAAAGAAAVAVALAAACGGRPAPKSTASAAPLTLAVDATDVARKLYHAHETLPVTSQTMTLVYPKWLPGEHAPTGPVTDLVGLHFAVGATAVAWHRDPVDMYAFHLDVPAGATVIDVTLDFSALTPAVPPGVNLTSYNIGSDGKLRGIFDDGVQRDMAQIAIADFNNPMGLEKVGETSYRESANSGAATVAVAGVGRNGTITAGALEMSNVDLAAEFTNLILAQRGFQASSRVITTSDQVLEDLVNIKR